MEGNTAYPTGLTRVPTFDWLVMVRSLEMGSTPRRPWPLRWPR